MIRHVGFGILVLLLLAGATARAEQPEKKLVRIAILPFDTSSLKEGGQDLGAQVTDLLQTLLVNTPDFELVQRAELDKVLREHSLNLTGLSDQSEQLKVGKLAGAQLLLTGRVFPLDRDLCLVAKLTGVETTKMTALLIQGPLAGKIAPLVEQLSTKIKDELKTKAAVLLPQPEGAVDTVELIRQALDKDKGHGPRKGKLPRIIITLPETMRLATAPRVDPAASTEFTLILKEIGCEIVDSNIAKSNLNEWAHKFLADSDLKPPLPANAADILLLGEGFSEFGARTGELVTCIARLEVQAVDPQTGKVLAVGRKTKRATDLSEGIAAKTALEQCARELAGKLLPEAIQAWRAAGVEDEDKK